MQTDEVIVLMMLGVAMGSGLTLIIQAYGRRKVRKALAAIKAQQPTERQIESDLRERRETAEMARRLAVLEQIVTDRPSALAEQIEDLRRETI